MKTWVYQLTFECENKNIKMGDDGIIFEDEAEAHTHGKTLCAEDSVYSGKITYKVTPQMFIKNRIVSACPQCHEEYDGLCGPCSVGQCQG